MKTDFLAISFSFLMTLLGLTGCGTPSAQPSATSSEQGHAAPCQPDTVYIEAGSGSWWGVLPSQDMELPREIYGEVLEQDTARWYWETPTETKTRTIRHAVHTRDTVVQQEVMYRDSTGRWHIVADSLQQELQGLEGFRKRTNRLITIALSLFVVAFCVGIVIMDRRMRP